MSLIETKNIDPNRYELTIQVGAEEFEAALERAYHKEKKNISLPGFRKGKAPRAMVEKLHGESVFFEDAVDELYLPAMRAAIDEAKLEVVVRPAVEITEVSKETGLRFVATCVTKPDLTVTKYLGLAVEKPVVAVSEEEVDQALAQEQEKHARLVAVTDRPTQNGDTVTFDFEGFVDNVPFEGGKAEGFELQLGSGQFIPGFEEQLEGHLVGETFDVMVDFPEEYHAENLAGQPARFVCMIQGIQSKEMPVLDDEFAKDVSEFDTLLDYRADVKQNLLTEQEQQAEKEMEDALLDALLENTEGEIPQELVDVRIDDMIADFSRRLESQGMTLELYLQYMDLDEESFRLTFADRAEKSTKIGLALEKIVKLEQIEIADEVFEAECEKLGAAYKLEAARVKELIGEESLRHDLAVQEAVRRMKAAAVVTEVSAAEQDDTESDAEAAE